MSRTPTQAKKAPSPADGSESGANSHGLESNVNHGQRRQLVAEALLAEIFQGDLQAGARLVIQDLARRFEVSPTPVREALVALEGMGILDVIPNRGAVVRRVTERDVTEVCQVRRALECEATRSACGRISLHDLQELADSLDQLQEIQRATDGFFQEARRIDSRLHDLIADGSGNRFLAKELNRLKNLFRAFRDVSYNEIAARDDFRRLMDETEEHLSIIRALQAGEPRDASRAMSRHIRSGLRYWSRLFPPA